MCSIVSPIQACAFEKICVYVNDKISNNIVCNHDGPNQKFCPKKTKLNKCN